MTKVDCPTCGKRCGSKAGLSSHRRARHAADPIDVPVAEAVQADLQGVGGPGSLRATAVKLGAAIDQTVAARDLPALSKELREVLADLGVGGVEGDDVDDIDEVTAKRRERLRASGTDVPAAPG